MVIVLLSFVLVTVMFFVGEVTASYKEKKLGYPKLMENDEDILFLIANGEESLAIRCCIRIYHVNLHDAQKKIAELKIKNKIK